MKARMLIFSFILVLLFPPPLFMVNGQFKSFLFKKKRQCRPHVPLPVDDTRDIARCRREVAATKQLKDPNAPKRTGEVILDQGYALETHHVTSLDGYISTIYRVPGGPRSPPRPGKPAVILFHGLGSVGDQWIVVPVEKNLMFKLVDAGYDVWVPNGRGTDVSQGHVSMNADKDIEYWDFSFHEMGTQDFPALVSHMLKVTRNDKLFFIGHSQGCTIMLIALAEYPELNNRIAAGFLMAPATYLGTSYIRSFTSLLPVLYTPLEKLIYKLFKGRMELRDPSAFLKFLGLAPVDLCNSQALQCDVCDNAFYLLMDFNPHQVNYTNTPNVVKMLNTANLKSYIHFGQNMLSCEFRKFDYGSVGNALRYGTPEPPSYALEKITAPIHIFYGEQDSFIPPPDIAKLASHLHPATLKGVHRVPDDTFDHSDFVNGRDADILVYNGLIHLMDGYVLHGTPFYG